MLSAHFFPTISLKKRSILFSAHSFISCIHFSHCLPLLLVMWPFSSIEIGADVNILDMFHLIRCHSVDRFHILFLCLCIVQTTDSGNSMTVIRYTNKNNTNNITNYCWLEIFLDASFVLTSALSSHMCNFSTIMWIAILQNLMFEPNEMKTIESICEMIWKISLVCVFSFPSQCDNTPALTLTHIFLNAMGWLCKIT